MKEHIGHLVDLQRLDVQRFREFLARTPVLSPADTQNRATENANYNQVPLMDIMSRPRSGRREFVGKLEDLTEDEVAIVSIHPRLQKSMRLLDWAYFLAEHDDHHLAQARQVIIDLDKNPISKETR